MTEEGLEGTVYDLDGKRLGRSRDIEGEFIAAVHQALADDDGEVVVVTSADVPYGFIQRLQRECEVAVEVDGDMASGVSLIVVR